MHIAAALLGIVLIFIVLLDTFETLILPRRVTQSLRPTRIFYRTTWALWSAMPRRLKEGDRRENILSIYGPLSLIMLLGVWAFTLISGFALLHWALGTQIIAPEKDPTFWTDLYLSVSTFFTLGLGDVRPVTPLARTITMVEAGIGFAFLALVIGYLPSLNGAFSQREVHVSLLDERAGSPPNAFELLKRHGMGEDLAGLPQILHDWERWSAELLESHLSYPVIGYFRSQHENQSWVAALTMILDASALVMVGIEGVSPRQAQLTFAMARHAAVDLSQVYNTAPRPPDPDRLPTEDLALLRTTLAANGVHLKDDLECDERLTQLRHLYEPYVNALSLHLLMSMPPWLPPAEVPDAWQTSAWERTTSVGTTEATDVMDKSNNWHL